MRRKMGAILAAVLLVALIAVIVWRVLLPGHSPPRATRKAGMLDLKTIDVRLLADVVGYRPSAAGNAGDDYAAAAEIAASDPAAWNAIASHVAAGAKKREFRYIFVHTPATLEVDVRLPALDRLMTVAGAMESLGKRHVSLGAYDRAEEVFRCLLVFGWHVQTERKHIHAVTTGLEIQRAAWFGLRGIYARPGGQDVQRLDALRAYESAAVELSSFYRRKRQIVWAADVWAGDLFDIIAHDQDRAWRVQAVLAMGRARSRFSDVDAKHAEQLLATLERCADPVLAAAARAARDHSPK